MACATNISVIKSIFYSRFNTYIFINYNYDNQSILSILFVNLFRYICLSSGRQSKDNISLWYKNELSLIRVEKLVLIIILGLV